MTEITETDNRVKALEEKLENLDRRWWDRPFHDRKSVLEQLYVSPRSILVFVTMLNIVLFIGGTVYTGIQVASIQKRYEEASTKILEAKQKYDEADSKLKAIQAILGDTQRQSEQLLANVTKSASSSANEITTIKEKAEGQFELLKKNSVATIAAMNSYRRDTEAALSKAADEVAEKIEQKIRFNKKAIENKQHEIDDLGQQIKGLSAEVEVKKLELKKIQNGLSDQLDLANRLNSEFTNTIKSISHSDKLTIPLAISLTSTWLKVLLGGLFVVCLLPGVLALLK
jgi:DNA repair exonuclease SbcCD ATPase subunit